CFLATSSNGQSHNLTVVIIRHGEKPDTGDNLSCQGFNRSLQIPKSLDGQFKTVASFVYVPKIKTGVHTSSVRMFQTVTPYAVKHNLAVNSSFKETDHKGVAADVLARRGLVLLVWEHQNIHDIVKALGVKKKVPQWNGKDFDSIWVVTFDKKGARLDTTRKEGITPSAT